MTDTFVFDCYFLVITNVRQVEHFLTCFFTQTMNDYMNSCIVLMFHVPYQLH